jgi:hypothetical protein
MKKGRLSNFQGKQGQMYAVLHLLWENYKARQKDFAKKNAMYTAALAEEQQEAIKKAEEMPDVAVRRDVPKQSRESLADAAGNCTRGWQDLSGLIESSYPEEKWDIKKGLAGWAYYGKAADGQWEEVIKLNNAAIDFITENEADLTNGGMLPGFPATYTNDATTFSKLYNDFYNARQGFEQQTTAKADASNAVYKTARGMMKVAQKMYYNDARTRDEFVYSSLMKKVRGKGFTKTGYCLILEDNETKERITTGTAVFTGNKGSKKGEASSKGIIRCELSSGDYNFTLTAPGYNPFYGTLKVVESSMRQKTIKLSVATLTSTADDIQQAQSVTASAHSIAQ